VRQSSNLQSDVERDHFVLNSARTITNIEDILVGNNVILLLALLVQKEYLNLVSVGNQLLIMQNVETLSPIVEKFVI